MTTIEQVVGQARSLLSAGLGNEMTRLQSAYRPLDPTIKMVHEKRVPDGAMISVGLTTLVAASSSSGREVAVVPGLDGSPDQSAPQLTLVHLRPRHTTWQIFREIVATLSEVTSPSMGLYQAAAEHFPVDVVDGTYVLSQDAIRILRVRYRRPGSTDDWHDVAWGFQPGAPGGATVRTTSPVPGGTTVQVQYAIGFSSPEHLDESLDSLGVSESMARLLGVGAARNLALATEARRSQPFSQGDPRRAEEVPITGMLSVYDRLNRQFRELVAEERARLVRQHPYRAKMEQFA